MTEYRDDWHRLADDFFTRLPEVPDDLRAEVDLLKDYNAQRQEIYVAIQEIRAHLKRQRAAKEAVRARIDAIAERQRIETELDLRLAELRRWNAKMARLKRDIDRVTDKIVAELRERRAQAERERLAHEKFAQMQQRRQDAQDLAEWESFKAAMLGEVDPAEQRQQADDEARLRQEYEKIKARKPPSEAENQAAWQDFISSLGDDA